MKKTGTSEEALLKALDEIEAATLNKADEESSSSSSSSSSSMDKKSEENEMQKSKTIPDQMKNQKAVNGGLSKEAGEGASDFEAADPASEGEPTEKSVVKSLVDENETLQKSFEVSDFLKSFSDVMIEAQEVTTNEIMKSLSDQQEFNEKVEKALVSMGEMLGEIKELMGDQPVVTPKTVLNKSQAMERFDASAPQYSSNQTAQALTDMAMKGECDTVAVSAYETTGFLPENLHGQVNQRLAVMFGRK